MHQKIKVFVCMVFLISGIFMSMFPLSAAVVEQVPSDDPVYLMIKQGDKEITVADLQTLKLQRAPFSFRFPTRAYNGNTKEFFAARIACSKTDQPFQFKVGTDTWDSSVFNPGQGMAAGPGGYSTMFLKDEAFHYIMYDLENPEDQRAVLIKTVKENVYEVEWEIQSINDLPIKKIKISTIYVAFFYDRDLDGIIDEGEYRRVIIIF